MSAKKIKIRDAIIPDIHVRLLDLCLGEGENGILMPIKFYEESRKNQKENEEPEVQDNLDKLLNFKTVPITMRKFLMYKHCQAS